LLQNPAAQQQFLTVVRRRSKGTGNAPCRFLRCESTPSGLRQPRRRRRADGRILGKIEALRNDLAGDVKRLTNFTPEYRLQVGNYRVLFEVEEGKVVVYRVLHRKDAYQ
jgi:mRNA interferase RelE/StbE